MMMTETESAEQALERKARELDADYRPIDDFSAWAETSAPADRWDVATARLAELRQDANEETKRRVLEGAMRAAAIDTGVIEDLYETEPGLTVALALHKVSWEAGLHQVTDDAATMARGQLEGYEMALDAATRKLPVTEAWIRQLHEAITAGQATYPAHTPQGVQRQPLPRGQYKTNPNHVMFEANGGISFAPVLDTAPEMRRLIDTIACAEFEGAHPAIQAAYAHHALTHVHPFTDGNGRTARAVGSVYLYRADGIPLVVFRDQKSQYHRALRSADEGERQAFVDFVAERALDVMELAALLFQPTPEDVLPELKRSFYVTQEVSAEQLDEAVYALMDAIAQRLSAETSGLKESGVTLSLGRHPNPTVEIPSLRSVRGKGQAGISLGVYSHGSEHGMSADLFPWVTPGPGDPQPVVIIESQSGMQLRARIEDVYPRTSMAFQARLDAWVDALLGHLLAELRDKMRGAFRAET